MYRTSLHAASTHTRAHTHTLASGGSYDYDSTAIRPRDTITLYVTSYSCSGPLHCGLNKYVSVIASVLRHSDLDDL